MSVCHGGICTIACAALLVQTWYYVDAIRIKRRIASWHKGWQFVHVIAFRGAAAAADAVAASTTRLGDSGTEVNITRVLSTRAAWRGKIRVV